MAYINLTLNHHRAVHAWVLARRAQAQLDFSSFELEITARNRYFRFYPRFVARIRGQLAHQPTLTDEAHGFIGWLPYRQPAQGLAADKIAFKRHVVSHGFHAPATTEGSTPPPHAYIHKRSAGSFGYGIAGPYPASTQHPPPAPGLNDRGQPFMEQFIEGRNLKLWFWGETPIHAHLDDYPVLTGDGASTLLQLLAARVAAISQDMPAGEELAAIEASLAFQGLALDAVPPPGRTAWIDFRYGRTFTPARFPTRSDSQLRELSAPQRDEAARMGQLVAAHLREEVPAPVLFSVDAVVDRDQRIWWLEMNTNPVFPPDGYAVMLDDLFGLRGDMR